MTLLHVTGFSHLAKSPAPECNRTGLCITQHVTLLMNALITERDSVEVWLLLTEARARSSAQEEHSGKHL